MITRRFAHDDTAWALALYRDLVADAPLAGEAEVQAVLDHPGTQIWGVWDGASAVAMATLHILPNVTQAGRPYALIENVVTAKAHRGKGHGRRVLEATCDAAWAADCYKIMLLTGRAHAAKGFYQKLGFSADEKWGMTQRRAPLRRG